MLNWRVWEKRGVFAARLAAGMAAWWCVAAAVGQDEGFRYFLDTNGVADAAPRPANDPLEFTNPTVGAGTGSGRFYLYLGFGAANQPFTGVNLRIEILGDAVFTAGAFYNHAMNGAPRRWALPLGALAPVAGSKSWIFQATSVTEFGEVGFGVKNWPPADVQNIDSHFRADDGSPFGTTLLGYFDVMHGSISSSDAVVRLMTGDRGASGPTISDEDFVYFGFGDAGTTNKRDRTSTDPDGYIAPVPEPATMFMGLAAILKWTVRRARSAA